MQEKLDAIKKTTNEREERLLELRQKCDELMVDMVEIRGELNQKNEKIDKLSKSADEIRSVLLVGREHKLHRIIANGYWWILFNFHNSESKLNLGEERWNNALILDT